MTETPVHKRSNGETGTNGEPAVVGSLQILQPLLTARGAARSGPSPIAWQGHGECSSFVSAVFALVPVRVIRRIGWYAAPRGHSR